MERVLSSVNAGSNCIFSDKEASSNPTTSLSLTSMNQYNSDTHINILWDEFNSLCDNCLDTITFKFSANSCPQEAF